jgi:penicillin V acylase-like amidase (Ntn superfamily)
MKLFLGLVIVFCALAWLPRSEACTAVFLHDDASSIIGRTMDWPAAEGFVSVNPKGAKLKAIMLLDQSKPVEWTSTYGSVTVNMVMEAPNIGKMNSPSEGMNENGLWVASLWVHPPPKVVYPPADSRPSINDWQLIPYLLDTSTSVKDALKRLEGVRVSGFKMGAMEMDLHWMLADASGDSAIIEFPNGKLDVRHPAEPPVMTNSFYDHLREYVKAYQGFGGTKAVPYVKGELTTENRFLFATAERERLLKSGGLTIDSGFEVVKKSTQTKVRHASTSRAITLWTTAWDLKNLKVQWFNHDDKKVGSYVLRNSDINQMTKPQKMPLLGP